MTTLVKSQSESAQPVGVKEVPIRLRGVAQKTGTGGSGKKAMPSTLALEIDGGNITLKSVPSKSRQSGENSFSMFQSSITKLSAGSRIAMIRKGFDSKQLLATSDYFDLARESIAGIVGISMPTLSRKLKNNALLSPTESERLARIALIEADTEYVFGTPEKAKNWLLKHHLSLGSAPLSMLDTDIGAAEVKRVLNAIAYGGVA